MPSLFEKDTRNEVSIVLGQAIHPTDCETEELTWSVANRVGTVVLKQYVEVGYVCRLVMKECLKGDYETYERSVV